MADVYASTCQAVPSTLNHALIAYLFSRAECAYFPIFPASLAVANASSLEHEVLPAFAQRFSLTMWYY